jgi:hypothetical protein
LTPSFALNMSEIDGLGCQLVNFSRSGFFLNIR